MTSGDDMDGLEVEARLEAPTEGALMGAPRLLAEVGMSCGDAEQSIALDHYLDTEDMAFRAAGWALRLRDAGTRKLLTLKALRPARDGLSVREEHEEAVEWDGAWSFSPEVLGGRVARLAGDARLTRLFGLRQDRLQLHAADDDGLWVEASMDKVRWEVDDAASTAFVLELELRQGTPAALAALLARYAGHSGWPTADWSKYEYGLSVAGLSQ